MTAISYIAAALAAYLLGSIPTGYLVARAKGVDIRAVGSGNIGATNVFRILGKTAGILVLTVDMLKGFLACWLVPILAMKVFGLEAGLAAKGDAETLKFSLQFTTAGQARDTLEWLRIVTGIAAILGHNYTCWLKFKGGKGVATTAGVLLALFPKAFLVGLAVWLAVVFISRYVSLASILAAVSLPVSAWVFQSSTRMIVVAALLGTLAIYKHKANIQRLLNGTENRFGKKKPGEGK